MTSPASTHGIPLSLPGFETEQALSRLGNNRQLYIKLLQQFLAHCGETKNQYLEALASGDMTGARRIAHTLKGLAGSIGATELARTSALLEASFTHVDREALQPLAEACFNSLTQTLNVLRSALATDMKQKHHAALASAAADIAF